MIMNRCIRYPLFAEHSISKSTEQYVWFSFVHKLFLVTSDWVQVVGFRLIFDFLRRFAIPSVVLCCAV